MINKIDINILQDYLSKENVFKEPNNSLINEFYNCINTSLPKRMKLQLISHYLIFYISQFRININYLNHLIPINSIAFLFSQSGTGKDTSIAQINKVYENSFKIIESNMQELNMNRAYKLVDGKSNVNIDDYLLELPSLNIGISTEEGLISSISNLHKIKLGSININTNEFIADLTNKSNLVLPLLSSIAEMYDLGNKSSKNLKDKTKQINELKNISLNSLFTSSFNIMDNIKLRNSLFLEFKSRFARRASITFNLDKPEAKYINSIDEWLAIKKESNDTYLNSIEKLSNIFEQKTLQFLNRIGMTIPLDSEAEKLYLIYQQYCLQYSETLDNLKSQLTKLNVINRYFQALKLSGALALLESNPCITKENFIQAINIVEVINSDIQNFEYQLLQSDYDILINYCKEEYFKYKDKIIIPLHTLTKYGFVRDSSQIKELLKQCNSTNDNFLLFTNDKNEVIYEYYEPNDLYFITYKKMDNLSKQERNLRLKNDWRFTEANFQALVRLLSKDFAYSSFQFKDNIRDKEHLIPKTNLLILDIDDSLISYIEMHDILKSSINHIISTTSDKNNIYKYRILFPLSNVFTIRDTQWKPLIKYISKDYALNINTDLLPQSQIFYSYKDSNILYTDDKNNLNIKPYLSQLNNIEYKPLTDKEKKKCLSSPRMTFSYAFNMKQGQRNITFIKMINHAYDLGMSYEDLSNLILEVNSYINDSLSENELHKHIYPHLNKKFCL